MSAAAQISDLITPEALGYTGRIFTIATIYPIAVSYHRPFKTKRTGGFWTDYDLPAAPMEGPPKTIQVSDGLQHEHVAAKTWNNFPITAESIAKDVVRNARETVLGSSVGLGPGVWICAGAVPTDAEIARERTRQMLWFRWLIADGDTNWYTEGRRNQTTDLHRAAAEWMHVDPRNHEWVHLQTRGEVKPCVFCRSQIDGGAAVCPNCQNVVDAALYEELKKVAGVIAKDRASLEADIKAAGIEAPPAPDADTILDATAQESTPGPVRPPVPVIRK